MWSDGEATTSRFAGGFVVPMSAVDRRLPGMPASSGTQRARETRRR
jgi:hypothetical protein